MPRRSSAPPGRGGPVFGRRLPRCGEALWRCSAASGPRRNPANGGGPEVYLGSILEEEASARLLKRRVDDGRNLGCLVSTTLKVLKVTLTRYQWIHQGIINQINSAPRQNVYIYFFAFDHAPLLVVVRLRENNQCKWKGDTNLPHSPIDRKTKQKQSSKPLKANLHPRQRDFMLLALSWCIKEAFGARRMRSVLFRCLRFFFLHFSLGGFVVEWKETNP